MSKLFRRFFYGTVMSLVIVRPVAGSQAHVVVTKTETNFMYVVSNDEPTNSNVHLDSFHLVVNAPIEVTGSPVGWSFATDNQTYVSWFSSDPFPPFASDIAPASSKGGFGISSRLPPELPSTSENLSYALSSWDHTTTNAGAPAAGSIEAPRG